MLSGRVSFELIACHVWTMVQLQTCAGLLHSKIYPRMGPTAWILSKFYFLLKVFPPTPRLRSKDRSGSSPFTICLRQQAARNGPGHALFIDEPSQRHGRVNLVVFASEPPICLPRCLPRSDFLPPQKLRKCLRHKHNRKKCLT